MYKIGNLREAFAKLPQDTEIPITTTDCAMVEFTMRNDAKPHMRKETKDLVRSRAREIFYAGL